MNRIILLLTLAASASLSSCVRAQPSARAEPSARAQDVKPFSTARMGVNLASAGFGQNLPGIFDKDYTYTEANHLDYYVANKLTLIRFPFRWERMQRTLRAPFDADEVARLRGFLQAAAERKMDVVLDVHNQGRYRFAGETEDQIIGAGRVSPADFADFWGKMAVEFKDEPALYGYGLMNEPHDMGDDERWPRAAQAAIEAIRKVDTITPIVVAGDGWSSSRNWRTSANAQLNDKLRDPANNLVYEAHCYFDKDRSGQYKADYKAELGSPDIGVENVRPFVEWCRENKVRGFIGEYGVTNADARWLVTMDRFLAYLSENNMPATYWAGGPWWDEYPLSIEPLKGKDGTLIDRPQMLVLRQYAGVHAAPAVRAASAVRAETSPSPPLWGEQGKNWSPQGRLTDWSFAGYQSGEKPIPTPPVKGNVRDFGARGDGVTDDTDAFQRAIAATNDGALLVPAGRYVLSDILYIRKGNFVLRGEGPEKSVLLFSKPLEAIKPTVKAGGRPTSAYSWSGGLIWVQGRIAGDELGLVKTPSARGEHVIELATAPAKVQVGQRIEIVQQGGDGKSLLDHLYSGQAGDVAGIDTARVRTSFVSRVVGVDGNKITLQRPLRTDIDPKWNATARLYAPTVSEVGVEKLGFEFPNLPYEGHFTELGFNVLQFSGVSDSWARDLRIFNADSGLFVKGNFVTLQNIVFDANRAPDKDGYQGHHGFILGSDTLLRDFDHRLKFIHDLTVTDGSAGNVASNGRGVDFSFDNHRLYPHANLFTNIDVGAGTDIYRSGGGGGKGKHSAAWTTWWNIRSAGSLKYPPAGFGPDSLNFVGVTSDEKPIADKDGRWFQPLSPTGLQPADLYEAQLARRLAEDKTKTN